MVVSLVMEEERLSSSSSGAKKLEHQTFFGPDNFIGKHRMAAAVSRLELQIQIIEEELKELDALGPSSVPCKEVIFSVDGVPDGLLPVTKAPADVGWDRWFRGTHSSHSHKRWM